MVKGENRLVGIDKNWVTDAFIGIGIFFVWIFAGNIFPFIGAIGIPQVQSVVGVIGKFLIICVAAPIFEELLFRDFILDFFDRKIVDSPFFVAAIISSLLFSFFHLAAYGESLSAASGSFVSAFLAGIVFSYQRKYTNSNISNIVTHALINFFIGFFTLAVFI